MSGPSLEFTQLTVEWVPRDSLKPNTYNPNVMTPDVRKLLMQSILEDGWTQPIITLPDNTIVDGEQRWTVAGIPLPSERVRETIEHFEAIENAPEALLARLRTSYTRLLAAEARGETPTLATITGGRVPRTIVDIQDPAHMMISTIRHNRARGTHQVGDMAAIAQTLEAHGLNQGDIRVRLGMTGEEIDRLLQSPSRLKERPDIHLSFETLLENDAARAVYEESAAADNATTQWFADLHATRARVDQLTEAAVEDAVKEAGRPLTQPEKNRIRQRVEAENPEPERPREGMLPMILLVDQSTKDTLDRLWGPRAIHYILQWCSFILENPEVYDEMVEAL